MTVRATRTRPHLQQVRALGAPVVTGSGSPFEVQDLDAYLARGGYRSLPSAEGVRQAAARALLRGAGGAGFPTATKLEAVAAAAGPRVVVANGEEGEPASAKDRWLLRYRPYLVLDGIRVAAHAVAAQDLYLYVSDPDAARAAEAARRDLDDAHGLHRLRVIEVPPGYVAGEETAVVAAIGGAPAKPAPKPPRPYQAGVGGAPTLVSNVESLARLALAVSTSQRAGSTVLLTVVHQERAELLEIELGSTVRQVLQATGANPETLLLGGFAGGIWPASTLLDATVSHDGLRQHGALLGCGAIVALGPQECPIAACVDVARFLSASSSGQCGACVRGTAVVSERLQRVAAGTGTPEDLDGLLRRAAALTGRGNCAMPDALALLIHTLDQGFHAELRRHLDGDCPQCRDDKTPTTATDSRFRVGVS